MVRRYARGEARRRAILEAAFEVLSRNGFRKTSLREIAREIDLEPAHLLYYFDSRESLLQEVIREWDARNSDTIPQPTELADFQWFVDAARRNTKSPGMVQAYLSFAAESSDAEHPSHEFFQARFDALRRAVLSVLRNMRARGEVAEATDLDGTATAIMALSDGLDLQWLISPSLDLPRALEDGIGRIVGDTRP